MFVLGIITGLALGFAANAFFRYYKISERKNDD